MSVMDEALHIKTPFYINYKKLFSKFRIGNDLYLDKDGDNRRGCKTSFLP